MSFGCTHVCGLFFAPLTHTYTLKMDGIGWKDLFVKVLFSPECFHPIVLHTFYKRKESW